MLGVDIIYCQCPNCAHSNEFRYMPPAGAEFEAHCEKCGEDMSFMLAEIEERPGQCLLHITQSSGARPLEGGSDIWI